MARRFRSSVVGSRTRSIRKSTWSFINIPELSIAANTFNLVGVLSAAELALRPFTIVRTHIVVSWASDQVAASEEALGAMGMLVVSEQAVNAGAASIPEPINDADSPWFVWQGMNYKLLFGDATGFDPKASNQYVVDSKAMRKVGINEEIVMMVTNADALHGARFSAIGRFLMKLH